MWEHWENHTVGMFVYSTFTDKEKTPWRKGWATLIHHSIKSANIRIAWFSFLEKKKKIWEDYFSVSDKDNPLLGRFANNSQWKKTLRMLINMCRKVLLIGTPWVLNSTCTVLEMQNFSLFIFHNIFLQKIHA